MHAVISFMIMTKQSMSKPTSLGSASVHHLHSSAAHSFHRHIRFAVGHRILTGHSRLALRSRFVLDESPSVEAEDNFLALESKLGTDFLGVRYLADHVNHSRSAVLGRTDAAGHHAGRRAGRRTWIRSRREWLGRRKVGPIANRSLVAGAAVRTVHWEWSPKNRSDRQAGCTGRLVARSRRRASKNQMADRTRAAQNLCTYR